MARSLQRIPTAVADNYPVAEGVDADTKPNGVAAAAILAASIGAFVLGVSIVVTEAIPAWTSAAGRVYAPAGPISGRSTLAVLAYVVALFVLIRLWHARNVNFGRVWTISLVLLAVGLLGSFPLFYGLFAPQ
jgi:hypothetical protein